MELNGTIALVTGAAQRVGREIALELARAGCDVAIHYNHSDRDAQSLAVMIESMDRRACLIQAELADPDTWPIVVERCVAQLGGLHILVNNASIFHEMSVEQFDLADWDRMFRINTSAPAALCHYAAPHLCRHDVAKIINITDISARSPWSNHLAYCASKAALDNLTRALALALAPRVQVNAVAPGIAMFPDSYDEATKARLVKKVPLKREGGPPDIARAVRFLCEADYITGQVISVDGGRSIA